MSNFTIIFFYKMIVTLYLLWYTYTSKLNIGKFHLYILYVIGRANIEKARKAMNQAEIMSAVCSKFYG